MQSSISVTYCYYIVHIQHEDTIMNIIKLKPLESWKSSAGLCLICGIPMGLESDSKMSKESAALWDEEDELNDGKDTVSRHEFTNEMMMKRALEEEPYDGEDTVSLHHTNEMMMMHAPGEGLEENFIRVSLFKYNLLGKMEGCHILDKYTFLKPKDSAAFKKAMLDNRAVIEAMGGDLIHDAFHDGAFERAADYCQRVAAKRMVPGCRSCNAAMNRANAHADIVYRCFAPTAGLFIPELEDSTTKTGRVTSKGNVVKKLIQQIALFYTPCYADGTRSSLTKAPTTTTTITAWKAKDEAQIMQHAAIWRCVANLCLWGRSGTVRFALVAIFYGAVYMFERMKMADLMLFTDWHLHVFRNFYMATYPNGASWFGMTQEQAAIRFDTTKKDGLRWCNHVIGSYLETACKSIEEFFRKQVSLIKISQFKEMITTHVTDEKTLFLFLCQKCGPKEGIQTLMQYFLRNFEDPRSTLMQARAVRFIKEIKPLLSKELLHSAKKHVAWPFKTKSSALKGPASTIKQPILEDEEEI
jgi:hypothetical protein